MKKCQLIMVFAIFLITLTLSQAQMANNTTKNSSVSSSDWWSDSAKIGLIGVAVGSIIGLMGSIINNIYMIKKEKT